MTHPRCRTFGPIELLKGSSLKIHATLDERAIQVGLIGKAARDKVGPQPTPAGLQPEPPADLKFKAALKLIAPILA